MNSLKANNIMKILSTSIERDLEAAVTAHRRGKIETASNLYRKVIAANPDNADAWHLLGVICLENGDFDQAAQLVTKAIQVVPAQAVYLNSLGNVFAAKGDSHQAERCYRKAIDLQPDYAEAHFGLGWMLQQQESLPRAADAYRHAIMLKQNFVPAHIHLGLLYKVEQQSEKAIECFQLALKYDPSNAKTHNSLGNMYNLIGRFNEARASFITAVMIKPDYPAALNNLGNTLQQLGRLEDALGCYEKAIQLQPNFSQAYYHMGIAYQNQEKSENAIACFRKAMEIDPDNTFPLCHIYHQLEQVCDWEELESLSYRIGQATCKDLSEDRKPVEGPFLNLLRTMDPELNLRVASLWSKTTAEKMAAFRIGSERKSITIEDKKITLGYLSNRFRNAATAHLMAGLFGLHNRDQFRVFCYSYGPDDGSHFRKRIKKDCDRFTDILDLDNVEAARQIHKDGVDILIDLKGYTRNNRLEISALRPAPIQVSYIGYTATTGADFIDYIITDRIVTPEGDARFYSEKFVYLPNSYMVNDNNKKISSRKFQRADLGLPDDGFVYCSFILPFKIDPLIFEIWMNILKRVRGSVLWLLERTESVEKNLRAVATACGVNRDRILFAPKMPIEEHLARLKVANLALDTRKINGHTTTSDALWAGVPVITLHGNHFNSRVSASLLNAVGMPELVTYSPEAYENLAVDLATRNGRLESVQEKLMQKVKTQPLFDTPRFVRNIEKAYHRMWHLRASGKRPEQIEIVDEFQ